MMVSVLVIVVSFLEAPWENHGSEVYSRFQLWLLESFPQKT